MIRAYLNKAGLLGAGAKFLPLAQALEFMDIRILVSSNGEAYQEITWGRGASKELEGFVESFSAIMYFNNISCGRRIGEYRHESARATLNYAKGEQYIVDMEATCFDDMRKLYDLIREGSTWPAVDYRADQVPPPYRHFRELINEMWQLIRREVKGKLYRI